jgi:hypothetical protein
MQQERRPTDLGAAPQRGATKLDVHPPPLPVRCLARVLYGGLLETSWASPADTQRAGRWLVATYRPGQGWAHRRPMPAGWGYNQAVLPDADSTAWALLALDGAGLSPTDGMHWALTGYRRFNGLYRTYADRPLDDTWTATHVDVTVVALQALLTMGTAEARPIEVTVERLLELAGQDCWHAYWWADDTYAVAQALQALAGFERWCARTGYGDADAATRTRVEALRRGVAGVLDAYRQQSEWVAAGRDPFGAALRLRAWASIGGAVPAARAAAERLLASQAPDGGWSGGQSADAAGHGARGGRREHPAAEQANRRVEHPHLGEPVAIRVRPSGAPAGGKEGGKRSAPLF